MPDPVEPIDPFHVAYVLIALVVTFLSCLIMGIMLTCEGAGVCRNVNRAPVSGGTEPEAQAPGGAPYTRARVPALLKRVPRSRRRNSERRTRNPASFLQEKDPDRKM